MKARGFMSRTWQVSLLGESYARLLRTRLLGTSIEGIMILIDLISK